MRPLHVLIFLLPLIVLYEVGSALFLTDLSAGTRETIKAYRLFGDFFNIFGVAGLFVPGLALATVLFVWHFISGDRWSIRWNSIAGMAAESLAWTLPLVVMNAATQRLSASIAPIGPVGGGDGGVGRAMLHLVQGGIGAAGGGAGGADLAAISWQGKLALSIGAGIYEEMLFRLVGIALIHFILKDLLGARAMASSIIAIVGSALAFALYHDNVWIGGGVNTVALAFYTLAGTFLGTIYVLRGFGIAVGTHATYDIVVLLLFASATQH
jgi:hypothetical protein